MNPSTGAVLSNCYAVGPLAAFSLADIDVARTPVARTTMPGPSNQNRATQATTTKIASPPKDPHMPGQPTVSQSAAMDHHKKDGKQ